VAQVNIPSTEYNAERLLEQYSDELTDIDGKIKECKKQIMQLSAERHRILAKIQDIDMDIVLQCISEKGLTSNEVLEIINNAAGN